MYSAICKKEYHLHQHLHTIFENLSFQQLLSASLYFSIETDRISATATVSAPTLFKMSFVPGFGFGHESFGQATATAETGE